MFNCFFNYGNPWNYGRCLNVNLVQVRNKSTDTRCRTLLTVALFAKSKEE
jgi:hypothetical protein